VKEDRVVRILEDSHDQNKIIITNN
jgi:hypothetical protein